MDCTDNKDIALKIPELNEISNSYMEDFMSEIDEILSDLELELVNLEMDPGNKEILNTIYCHFHTLRGLLGLLNNLAGTRIATASEELLETVKKYSQSTPKDIINTILESIKYIKELKSSPQKAEDLEFSGEIERHVKGLITYKNDILLEVRQSFGKKSRIGEILVQEGALDESQVKDVLEKQSKSNNRMKFGEIVLREKKVEASDIIKAIRMQKIRNTGASNQYVKIPLERLDQIISIIQEVSNLYDSVKDESVLRFGSNDSLTIESTKAYHKINDIKNILKELRMVTLQQAFQKLTRSVCSIIEENHQEVIFSTLGENVEVDKEVADRISLPLDNLIRLLLDKVYHKGDEKTKRIGNIEVVAYSNDNNVHIDITGDSRVDIEDIKNDGRYIESMTRLNSMKCDLDVDDLHGEGVRFSIIIQR